MSTIICLLKFMEKILLLEKEHSLPSPHFWETTVSLTLPWVWLSKTKWKDYLKLKYILLNEKWEVVSFTVSFTFIQFDCIDANFDLQVLPFSYRYVAFFLQVFFSYTQASQNVSVALVALLCSGIFKSHYFHHLLNVAQNSLKNWVRHFCKSSYDVSCQGMCSCRSFLL